MKLLGWIHRKFRENNGVKDYNTTNAFSFNCLCVPSSPEEFQFHRHRRRPPGCHGLFTEAEGGSSEDVLFKGLLAIGTLGSGPPSVEVKEEEEEQEVTPALVEPVSTVEAIAENEVDAATEEELMVVGAELEKMLLAEAEQEDVGDRLSFVRPSHVGIKGSAVTACPLQGYLFGSAVEAKDMAGRKDRRASLGELFMMSGVVEDEGESCGKGEETAPGGGGGTKPTTGIRLGMIKKMLRGGGSGAGRACWEGNPVSGTKFNKVLNRAT